MASLKLTAALAVVAVCAALAATPESCGTQNSNFINCLRRGFGERCCAMVETPRCFCQVEREAEIHCVPGRSCPSRGFVKVAEMHLRCMKNLKCKRA